MAGTEPRNPALAPAPSVDPVLAVVPLGFPWQTADPFLFCVHHDDAYPAGNEAMGPAASLAGRQLGMDFEGRDGWRMYHGENVPGFPAHPHRGFETVTIVRRGFIDHSDSLGATARFGHGDTQWLTAGRGIVHAEMFPLVERERGNPLELFQIWLNLPAAKKLVDPHFSMFWSRDIPHHVHTDESGGRTEVEVVAGRLAAAAPPAPPPNSWAAQADSDVAIWVIKMSPNARFTLPAAHPGSNRTLYLYEGDQVQVAGRGVAVKHGVQLRPDAEVALAAGAGGASLLLLQGRPIAEPVVQYGPFVMNTRSEIQAAFADYQRTQFGDWPFANQAPVHPREESRFARHADGRVERPE
ncbi:MAG TPA: pirin family protein [Polyangia bacterium]